MGNYVEYVNIHISADMEELDTHLSRNGYDFGIDLERNFLFVNIEEVPYVETILEDRNIAYITSVHLF